MHWKILCHRTDIECMKEGIQLDRENRLRWKIKRGRGTRRNDLENMLNSHQNWHQFIVASFVITRKLMISSFHSNYRTQNPLLQQQQSPPEASRKVVTVWWKMRPKSLGCIVCGMFFILIIKRTSAFFSSLFAQNRLLLLLFYIFDGYGESKKEHTKNAIVCIVNILQVCAVNGCVCVVHIIVRSGRVWITNFSLHAFRPYPANPSIARIHKIDIGIQSHTRLLRLQFNNWFLLHLPSLSIACRLRCTYRDRGNSLLIYSSNIHASCVRSLNTLLPSHSSTIPLFVERIHNLLDVSI